MAYAASVNFSGPGGEHLAAQGYEKVMIAPLSGERRLLGELALADRGTCGPDELVGNADVAMSASKHGFSVYQREMEVAR